MCRQDKSNNGSVWNIKGNRNSIWQKEWCFYRKYSLIFSTESYCFYDIFDIHGNQVYRRIIKIK